MKVVFNALNWVKIVILLVVIIFGCQQNESVGTFKCSWPKDVHRTWIGPEYWANPLQDWEIENGKLRCLVSDYNRNVSLLTWEKSTNSGSLTVIVQL